ncbi:MAG: FGGY family carbohydrate kinase [Sphaerochaeta associata]|uniref:xylulokinase n=1 Tax=Sphaerochaeta associata TaxID=1129264 RepID=UPI002B20C228|nr:FGGY family carbohydrate kinase [Sphaerochaeta associata]MEA5107955.1 FGGY family carbohydrate kinase [Sphaerochaeta associata]
MKHMRYLLGADFGGGSTKVTVLDEKGRIVATSSEEYPSLYPRPLFVEQDPEVLYQAFARNVRRLFECNAISLEDVMAISIDGGTHIAVLMDSYGRVIRPAIYWSDGRSSAQAALLKPMKEKIASLSCNTPSSTWTLPQLMWIKDHEPDNFKRIHQIRFLKDYIRFRLTGDFVTDSIEAMGSMLVDTNTDAWSEYLCDLAGLRMEMLPAILPPHEIVGTIQKQACKECGFSNHTKVVVGSTDTVMELLAAGAIGAGDTTIKLATAGRICVVSPHKVVSPLLVTYKHVIPGLWYPGSATKSCAASMRWFRDTLAPDPQAPDAYQKIDALAASIPAGSDNLFFHPYLQGEITPYLDEALRASFIGVSSSHTYAHFCRSVLEGVAFSLREGLDCIRSLGMLDHEPLRIIGGGSRSALWSQIVSDVLQVRLVKVTSDDSSIGSAMHAGVVCGVFDSYHDAVSKCTVMGEQIVPNENVTEKYEQSYAVYKSIVKALQPIYQELN